MRMVFAFAAVILLAVNTAQAGSALAGARTLRAVSYNIWGLPAPLLKKASRIPDIARVAPLLNADIIAFQETFTSKAKILAALKGYRYHAWGKPRGGLFSTSDGLLIVSKWPIVSTATLTYSRCEGTDCLSRKGALHARVRVDGVGDVDVFNTHTNASDRNEWVRETQIQELYEFVSERSDNNPVVLMGDFNFVPDSAAYSKMIYLIGARDGHREFAHSNPGLAPVDREGLTYHPSRNSNVAGSKPGQRLDYVWVRDLASRKVEVVRTRLVFDAPVSGRHLSDHFGVLADLSFETQD